MPDTSEKTTLETAKDRASDLAGDITDAATDKVKEHAADMRDQTADTTQQAADAAQAAADEFDSGSMQAQAIEQIARRIDDIAQQVRSSDIDRMARTVGDAAQRNPLMFVAGAALAGFAVTRFLKARDPQRSSHDDPWASTRDATDFSRPTQPSRGAL